MNAKGTNEPGADASADDHLSTVALRALIARLPEVQGPRVESLTVFLPFLPQPDALGELLAQPPVRSVIVSGDVDAFPDGGDRVGLWDAHRAELRFPDCVGRVLVCLSRRDQIFVRLLVRARSAGLRSAAIIEPLTGTVSRYRIGALLAGAVVKRVSEQVRRHRWQATAAHLKRSPERAHWPGSGGNDLRGFLRRFPDGLLRPEDFAGGGVQCFIGSLGRGGAERQLVNTVLGLPRHDWPVTVSCEFLQEDHHRFFLGPMRERGIQVEQLGAAVGAPKVGAGSSTAAALERAHASFAAKPPGPYEEMLLLALFSILQRRPEVVHAWLDATNIKAGLAALAAGVPRIVLSQRSMAPTHFELYQPYMEAGYRLLGEQARITFLNNSQAGARDYERWLGFEPGRIAVIHNGLHFPEGPPDPARVAEVRRVLGVGSGELLVGTVIRFSEEKRPLLWLETASRIARDVPAATFAMFGDGPLRGQCEERSQQEPLLRGRIRFPGTTHTPLVSMAAMDVFLLTSRMEGLPNVLIEAQSVGVPVVTAAVGGAPETLADGETGYAVRDATAARLAVAVATILRDPDWRRSAAAAATRFARERFHYTRMVEHTLSVYRLNP